MQAWHCQSSNSFLAVIQLGDVILTLGMHKCTHYSFIFFYFHVYIFSHHPHALHSDNLLDEKQEIITTYLDAGVIPCGNSTYDL